jgi:peroxiredoxin
MTAPATPGPRPPVSPGDPAPDFSLPTVHQEGVVSLASYRGKSPLLLAVFRGLWCPFCRRHIAELGPVTDKLRALGVETLCVVATDVSNARLYFKHRPTRVPLAADPECTTHQAYGLPKPPMTPEAMQALATTKVNPTGELPEPLPVLEAGAALDRLHGFQGSPTDQSDFQRQAGQLKGQFLVDRAGIVRWTNVECAAEGLSGLGKFPTAEDLLRVARTAV